MIGAPTQLHLAHAGLAARLRVVFPPARFQHQMLPSKLTAQSWGGITATPPFVGLGWDGVLPQSDNGRLFQGDQTWQVMLVAANPGGIAQRYTGDALGIGLFHMVAAAVATLSGHTIAGVGTVQVHSVADTVSPDWDMGNCAMAMLGLRIPGAMTPDAVLDDIELSGMLETLGIDWGFAPQADTIQDVTPLGSAATQ